MPNPLENVDWSRFDWYAGHIRSLELDALDPVMTTSAAERLVEARQAHSDAPIIPNLLSMTMSLLYPSDCRLFRLLVGPRLSTLDLVCSSLATPLDSGLIEEALHKYPLAFRQLNLRNTRGLLPIPFIVRPMANLRGLSLRGTIGKSSDLVRALRGMRHLETLTLGELRGAEVDDPVACTEVEDAFMCLREIDATHKSLPNILTPAFIAYQLSFLCFRIFLPQDQLPEALRSSFTVINRSCPGLEDLLVFIYRTSSEGRLMSTEAAEPDEALGIPVWYLANLRRLRTFAVIDVTRGLTPIWTGPGMSSVGDAWPDIEEITWSSQRSQFSHGLDVLHVFVGCPNLSLLEVPVDTTNPVILPSVTSFEQVMSLGINDWIITPACVNLVARKLLELVPHGLQVFGTPTETKLVWENVQARFLELARALEPRA